MSKVGMVRALVEQRLAAAAEEIFGLFERTIAEYEQELCRSKEENERQQKLLDAVWKPGVRLHRAGGAVQQLLVNNEDVSPQQHEWNQSLDQDPPEPPRIKEEEGGSQEGPEEADIITFPFVPVLVKSEDDDEEERHFQPETGDRQEITGSHIGSTLLRNNEVSDDGAIRDSCSPSGSIFKQKSILKRHEEENKISCSICSKMFKTKQNLTQHMVLHTGERNFICSVCGKTFNRSSNLRTHMSVHTGERNFSCSVCSKSFTMKQHLNAHMVVHTGERNYICSVCGKTFSQNATLTGHMAVHTGEKRFCCGVCNRKFTWDKQLKRHKCAGPSSSQLHHHQEELFTPGPVMRKYDEEKPQSSWLHQRHTEQMETGADGED